MRAEADTDAATIRARADLESAELHQAAERDRDQAKRLLTHAQEQADTIISEAEVQARTLVDQASEDATRTSEELLGRSRRHAEQILRAERAVVDRLQDVRTDVDAAIDRLTGSEERPVLDLTSGEPVLRVGGLPVEGGDEDDDEADADPDPLRTMIRAAVDRAADEGANASDVAATRPTATARAPTPARPASGELTVVEPRLLTRAEVASLHCRWR